ncbi:AbrB/MazE/SpoVT family DNA-binding domain-containing protein [Spiribacter sp. 221]|uniref:AbrB/MazE/SpoVT family DNA-binding domain-containing protein n=1 Tax=Spiribacter onubensis TaxID=3122420 RepID=UPI00349F88BD
MATTSNEIQIGAQGRLVVPAALRRELGLQPGERLLARVKDGALILEPRQVVERRLRNRFRQVDPRVNLADALIEERRAEAMREAARGSGAT